MKKQLQLGTDGIDLTNRSIRRAFIDIVYSETAIANQGIDLSQITINVKVNQKGVEDSTNIQALPAYAKYLKEVFAPILPTSFAPGVQVLRTFTSEYSAGVSSTNVVRIPVLEDTFILKGNDKVRIDVQTPTNAFGSANVGTNQVYIVVEDGTDLVQEGIILPRYYPVLNNSSNPLFDLGGVVTQLVLISGNGNSYASDIPFKSANLSSKYYNDTFDNTQISTLPMYEQFYANTPVFTLFDSKNGSKFLQNVSLQLTVDTTDSTIGGDWVCSKTVTPVYSITSENSERFNKIRKSKRNVFFM